VPVYLGIGILQCASEQIITLGGGQTYSFGASAIVYGMLAMCMVWAPKNDLNCAYWFLMRIGTCEVPIMLFAFLYIGLEAVTVIFSRFALTSSLLHLMGAIWGFAIAAVMLKMNWVDCENWDLFAVMSRTHGSAKDTPARKTKKRRVRAADPAQAKRSEIEADRSPEAKSAAKLERLKRAIADGLAVEALAIHEKTSQALSGWELPEADLFGLIKLLHQDKMWSESVPLMEQYVRRFPVKAVRMRLKLAQVLARDQQRPVQALRVLAEIPEGVLPEELEQIRKQIEQKATQMRDDGVLEIEGESW
jgi:hypothetical protein